MRPVRPARFATRRTSERSACDELGCFRLRAYLATGQYRHELADARWIP